MMKINEADENILPVQIRISKNGVCVFVFKVLDSISFSDSKDNELHVMRKDRLITIKIPGEEACFEKYSFEQGEEIVVLCVPDENENVYKAESVTTKAYIDM